MKTMKEKKFRVSSFICNTSRRKKRCFRTSKCGLKRMTSGSIIHIDLHKPNNKLIKCIIGALLVMDKPWAYTDSQSSSWPKLGEATTFPPLYNIICDSPQGLHPNGVFPKIPKSRIPKFSKLKLLPFCTPIISYANLQLRQNYKKNYSPCQELLDDMWHAPWMYINQSNS